MADAPHVLVLGTGGAGLTAAISAHEAGARVSLFEKGDQVGGTTAWTIGSMDGDDDYGPGKAPFMVNYRVADLDALLDSLRAEGCNVVGNSEPSEYGKFGWVIDPEGNKVELWEPPAGQ